MPTFKLEVETEGREVYYIDAANEDAARALFDRGDSGSPDVSEVTGVSIERIEEVTE